MIYFIFAALCAYFVKGLCGFANTLVFTTILSFGVDNVSISPVDLILGFPSNVILAWRNRHDLNWRIWAPLAALVLLGNIPGVLLLKNAAATCVKIMFGVAVIGIGLEMLCREYKHKSPAQKNAPQPKGAKAILMLIGLVSGLLCGLYGVGALLAAYMSRVTDSNQTFKANICAVFIVENIFRIIVYSLTGILTLQVIRQSLWLIPAMLAGLWAGMKCSGRLDEAAAKKIVTIVLILSGISLIITNLI